MIVVRPKTITDAVLTASNIPESDPVWSAAAVYALGDVVTVAGSHRLFESQSGGTSHEVTISIASPGIVTWPAHGLAEDTPIVFETTGALPTGIVAGTVYFVTLVGATADTFKLTTAPVSAAVNTSGTQSGVHTAIVGANLGLDPTTDDGSHWIDIGPTNRWAMFDKRNVTVTSDPAEIDVTLALTGRVDSLALFGLANAVSARVIVSTPAAGTLYDVTRLLTSTEGVADWYSWFFEEVERKSKLLLTDLPLYNDPTIRVIVAGTGTSPLVLGNLVVGQSKDLGETLEDGAEVGITDFSRKETDGFGNPVLVERPFADFGTFQSLLRKGQVDGVRKVLAQLRATPAAYSASPDYDSATLFGWYKSFSIGLGQTDSTLTIELEGLT